MAKTQNIKARVKLTKMADVKFDPKIFQPMLTKTPVDYMFSSDGGFFPATNYMLIGDPGIGKSTFGLDILAEIQSNDPSKKVLFISGEMNQIDMYGYVQRYPKFKNIDTLFLCDYLDTDPKDVIERTFKLGWDIILIDSFIEVQEAVQASNRMTRTHAEKWFIDLMITHNKGQNRGKHYTSFLAIQQVTKGGNFVGSNKLKHNTTGMCELRYSNEFAGDRYIKFTKNRRGFKYEKLYFNLESTGSVNYDIKRLERDEEIKQRIAKEKENMLKEEELFNMMFTRQAEIQQNEQQSDEQ
jgi:predicted ATP-dependent serine protease